MEFKNKRDQYIGMVGQLFIPLFPERVKKLEESQFTLSEFGRSRSKLDQILRFGLLYKAIRTNDLERLASYHENYWKSDAAAQYHEDHAFIFEEVFIPQFSYLLEIIQKEIEASGKTFDTLVEIGSGSGQLLDYLSKNMEGTVEQFVGIDLSPKTVETCNKRYGNERVNFVAADGDAWIRENGQQNWIYLSHRGVLEYFPKEQLLSFFTHIATRYSPTILVTIEPVGVNHDLENNFNSQPYSNEYSFSHNYPHIMTEAGFKIIHTDLQPRNPKYNLLAVVASSGLDN